MGTQQLLLIVLGVVIVGIAIAVGISIFNNQSYLANQQAVAQENSTYASMILQWWKTPIAQGGHGLGVLATGDDDMMANWLGFGADASTAFNTDSGKYAITSAADGTTTVIITACGTEVRGGDHSQVDTTVNLATSSITSVVSTDDNGDPLD